MFKLCRLHFEFDCAKQMELFSVYNGSANYWQLTIYRLFSLPEYQ